MNRPLLNATVSLLILLAATTEINAQSISDSTKRKIDSLFKKWDNYNSPGFAIGIVRNDSLVYSRGYGMANLEYNIRITPQTIFHMASVSKQFTAFCIVLLAKQGRLRLDDDIHKYLSWFPDLKEKITIRQLLNHTSGIRDQWQLLAIAGTRLDDVITQEQIVKVLSKQQALNFKPGEQYSYSNSGFTMLAEIIKAVTGKTLRQFSDSAIFRPLGMMNTHFHDDYTEIVPGRSYSYDRTDSAHYANSILSYSNAGATSLFTNVDDMSKWIMNFYTHKVGDQGDIDQLAQKGKLNNGRELNYALGIGVGDYNGHKLLSHNGADAGYRTSITVVPDLKTGVIVFSNLGDTDPSDMAQQIGKILVPATQATESQKTKKEIDSSGAILKGPARFASFMGDYISEDGVQFSFKMQDQKVYWVTYGQTYLLSNTKDSFSMVINPEVKFVFSGHPQKTAVVDEFWPDGHRSLTKYVSPAASDDQLRAYTGIYFCPELDCKYGITLNDHHLVLTNDKYNDMPLRLAGPDHLFSDFWWMSHMVVVRNNKEITGFEVSNGRVMHLWFKKIE